MTFRSAILDIMQQEELNFLLTNRIPRRLLTHGMGWLSAIEQPTVRDLSIALFRWFCDVDLSDAAETRFRSLHHCFIRELRPGARPLADDPSLLVSPCDGVVGAHGSIRDTELIQAKGFTYTLSDLIHDPELVQILRDGVYVTLRIKAGMYHRFHAPHDGSIDEVAYISGETWNVNPVALRRIERLFCKNERAVLRMRLDAGDHVVALVPVAAVLVASIRLHFLDVVLHLRYRGPSSIPCNATCRKGQELGWFEHGSTLILCVPRGFTLCDTVREGAEIRMGQPLARLP